MPKQRLDILFRKCLDNAVTDDEKLELHALINDPSNAAIIQSYIEKVLDEPATANLPEAAKMSILSSIVNADAKPTALIKPLISRWIKYAAAVIVVIGIGSYFLSPEKVNMQAGYSTSTDIMPGGNRATLTLADGTTIILDTANNNTLAQQGSIQVVKLANGQLAYKTLPNVKQNSAAPLYNTISTPVGGQYQVLLPDGTNVWLNAASTMRFPAVFNGAERNVELTGEAYFDVAGDPSRPFIVKSSDINIKVLGTEFNIMAYPDEQTMRTTLINGSVNVVRNGRANILRPGQQANIQDESVQIISDANIEEALAWKNGKFYFNGADLRTVMRQIGRWYDVQVIFEGNTSNEKFEGEISRNSPLSEVLKILKLTSVHFRMEGNKLIVLP